MPVSIHYTMTYPIADMISVAIVGSTHVWIDHCYIKNIGRQFIATYDSSHLTLIPTLIEAILVAMTLLRPSPSATTFSMGGPLTVLCQSPGQLRAQALNFTFRCNNEHYWGFIFTGTSDTITFAQNHVYMTSGEPLTTIGEYP
jgi:pectin lyase